MNIQDKNTKYLKDLYSAIEEYDKSRLTLNIESLMDIRDRISLSLFGLIDFYTAASMENDAVTFQRKVRMAEIEESLRGQKNPDTGKPKTREELANLALIQFKDEESTLSETTRVYKKIRLLFEQADKITNSIASRINKNPIRHE